jgi:hypothetical protein
MAASISTLERKRIIKSLKAAIREMGLSTQFDTNNKHKKKNACCMILMARRELITDYEPALLADILKQASGSQMATNFIKGPVAITRDVLAQQAIYRLRIQAAPPQAPIVAQPAVIPQPPAAPVVNVPLPPAVVPQQPPVVINLDQSCDICRTGIQANEISRRGCARHWYHEQCCRDWIRLQCNCPTCLGALM